MPRLLLVDDNPSIHKIAETLLATTPIELVCVDSASAALEKVNRGERFDVALIDTSMAGMDGWGLLAKFREMPETARMPIAMMAGVLDTVDPERIKEAPIQGFLKKPVELRELGDRIARLMETPVPIPEPPLPAPKAVSPFATMPAVRIEDLPEFRRRTEEAPEPASAPPEAMDDVLELTEEDLFPEPAPEAVEEIQPEEGLDLEELDIDSLRHLEAVPEEEPSLTTPAPLSPFPALDEHAEPTPQSSVFPIEELDAISTLDRLPEAPLAAAAEVVPAVEPAGLEMDLPDLGPIHDDLLEITSLNNLPEIEDVVTLEPLPEVEIPLASLLEEPAEEAAFTPPLPPLEESLDWSDDSDSMLAVMEPPVSAPQVETAAAAMADEELDLLNVPVPDLAAEPDIEAPTLHLEPEAAASPEVAVPVAVPTPEPAVPLSTEAIVESALLESAATPVEEIEAVAEPAPAAAGLDSWALMNALMADPALMDALAKAVVTRLGDQVLRDIAWEVMPELAERLPRK